MQANMQHLIEPTGKSPFCHQLWGTPEFDTERLKQALANLNENAAVQQQIAEAFARLAPSIAALVAAGQLPHEACGYAIAAFNFEPPAGEPFYELVNRALRNETALERLNSDLRYFMHCLFHGVKALAAPVGQPIFCGETENLSDVRGFLIRKYTEGDRTVCATAFTLATLDAATALDACGDRGTFFIIEGAVGARVRELSVDGRRDRVVLPPNSFMHCSSVTVGQPNGPSHAVNGITIPGGCDVVWLRCETPRWWTDMERCLQGSVPAGEFDNIKERILGLNDKLSQLEQTNSVLTQNNTELAASVATLQQSVATLVADKDMLTAASSQLREQLEAYRSEEERLRQKDVSQVPAAPIPNDEPKAWFFTRWFAPAVTDTSSAAPVLAAVAPFELPDDVAELSRLFNRLASPEQKRLAAEWCVKNGIKDAKRISFDRVLRITNGDNTTVAYLVHDVVVQLVALHSGPTLTHVNVSNTAGKITDAAIITVAQNCPSLCVLSVEHTKGKITDAAISVVALRCPKLCQLFARDTCWAITDLSIKKIGKHCTLLSHVDLADTHGAVTDSSITTLALNCPNLTELNVYTTAGKITAASLDLVRARFPKLKIYGP